MGRLPEDLGIDPRLTASPALADPLEQTCAGLDPLPHSYDTARPTRRHRPCATGRLETMIPVMGRRSILRARELGLTGLLSACDPF
jgi:hypothetical protein